MWTTGCISRPLMSLAGPCGCLQSALYITPPLHTVVQWNSVRGRGEDDGASDQKRRRSIGEIFCTGLSLRDGDVVGCVDKTVSRWTADCRGSIGSERERRYPSPVELSIIGGVSRKLFDTSRIVF